MYTPICSLEQLLSSSQGTSSEEDTGFTVICNIKICYEFSHRATSFIHESTGVGSIRKINWTDTEGCANMHGI